MSIFILICLYLFLQMDVNIPPVRRRIQPVLVQKKKSSNKQPTIFGEEKNAFRKLVQENDPEYDKITREIEQQGKFETVPLMKRLSEVMGQFEKLQEDIDKEEKNKPKRKRRVTKKKSTRRRSPRRSVRHISIQTSTRPRSSTRPRRSSRRSSRHTIRRSAIKSRLSSPIYRKCVIPRAPAHADSLHCSLVLPFWRCQKQKN